MGTRMSATKFSWAFVDEASYGVKPAIPIWIPMVATRPEFSKARDIEELSLAVSSDFAIQPRVVGSRHGGTFTFSVPIRSQLPTYNDPTDPLAQNPEVILLEDVMGAKHTGVSAAAEIALLSTACVWKVTAATPDEGACYYTGTNGAQTVNALGWVTDLTGTTATLFEDGRAIPAAGQDLYGMYTLASDDSQPTSKTFFFKGQSTEHGLYLTGCIPTGANIRLANGKVPTIEFSYMFDSWEYDTASGAGLLSETDYKRLPPIMGIFGGRVTLDGGSTGVADVTGRCGVGEISIEITNEVYSQPCHGAPQGFAGIDILSRKARASFSIPWTQDDITAGQTLWDDSLENGTPISVMVQVGSVVGQVFSLFIPTAVVVDQSQLGEQDTAMVWTITVSPDSGYAGDSGAVFPANTSFRLAIG